MGATLSTQKFLATPLSAQWKFPFVVNPRFCRRRVTTLALTDNFWAQADDVAAVGLAGFLVREVGVGRVLFRVLPTVEGVAPAHDTKWLLDEYDIPVAHLTAQHTLDGPDDHAMSYAVCLGKRREPAPRVLTTLQIKFVPGRGDPLMAEIADPHTGGTSRLGCHGLWRQRAAVLYLERGRGGRREPIAKIYRPSSTGVARLGGDQSYHVETAVGVDLALVLLICAAMDDASAHFHRLHKKPLLGSGIH